MDKPGQTSLNRTERIGLPEHDRKDRIDGTGQPGQDSHKRIDSQDRSVNKGLPKGHSR